MNICSRGRQLRRKFSITPKTTIGQRLRLSVMQGSDEWITSATTGSAIQGPGKRRRSLRSNAAKAAACAAFFGALYVTKYLIGYFS